MLHQHSDCLVQSMVYRCGQDTGGSDGSLHSEEEMSGSLHISCCSGTMEITG